MNPPSRLRLSAAVSFLPILLAPLPGWAYVGPGAGLSLLGALWALVVAVFAAVAFVVLWPLRRAMRRRRMRQPTASAETPAAPGPGPMERHQQAHVRTPSAFVQTPRVPSDKPHD